MTENQAAQGAATRLKSSQRENLTLGIAIITSLLFLISVTVSVIIATRGR